MSADEIFQIMGFQLLDKNVDRKSDVDEIQ